jgi:hypothetical protein
MPALLGCCPIVEIDAQAGAGTDAVIGSGDRRFVHGQSHGELWNIHVVV